MSAADVTALSAVGLFAYVMVGLMSARIAYKAWIKDSLPNTWGVTETLCSIAFWPILFVLVYVIAAPIKAVHKWVRR